MFTYSNKNVKGLMLIELLMAITISMIITSMLIEIYITMQRNYRLQIALNEMQGTAKKVMSIMSGNIKNAGNIGCARLSKDFPIVSYAPFSLFPNNKITGNSSEIMVMHAAYPEAKFIGLSNPSIMLIGTRMNVKAGFVFIISDCKHAEVFTVVNAVVVNQVTKLTINHALQYQYEKDAEVSMLEANKFFVAKTRRMYANGKPIYALYCTNIYGNKYELADGVTNIRFEYDISEPPFHANQITDASTVIGVSIQMDLDVSPLEKTWFGYVSLRDK